MDAGAMALLYDAASGAERSPPARELSCTRITAPPARAAPMDMVVGGPGDDLRSTALPRFMLLYAVMYAGFGVASPFLPAFVSARGLSAAQIGLMFGAGTAVRLLTAPLAGRTGDVLQGSEPCSWSAPRLPPR